jgi:uncharacterized protein YdcH (DUF465 family)
MNISLRKANAIQNSINETIRSIKIVKEIKINEFQDVATELQKANDVLFAADTRRQRLLLALYNIRGLVGAANAQNGIDMKLATAAFLDKRISQLDELSSLEVMTDLTVITGQLDKIKNRPDGGRASIYGYHESVETSVVTQVQLDQIKNEIKHLKKQKQKVNDEILELNIKTEVPLSEDVVKTLTEEGLI